ncbi:MAG TPA: serine hydrolase domain-containing protein [Clostridia bacterium]|nr:serine hydrolase domain-containing protein [Clostridia bacterium]
MKKRTIIAFTLLFVLLTAVSSILQMRGSYLDREYTEDIIGKARQKYQVPAISVSVMDSRQIRFTVFDGVREYGKNDRITQEDYFHLGSCSKSVLAYIAARMVEGGSIRWDTKFFDIYPEMKAKAKKSYYKITLEDLLACRSGMQPYTSGTENYPDLSESQNRELDFIKYLLMQEPVMNKNESDKTGFLYSNAGYTLAAAMLEKVSGLPYEDLIREYIVRELGLDVFVGWPYEKSPDQPRGHLPGMDGTPSIIGPGSAYALNPLINPAGNLSMKSGDFAKFVQLHLQGMTGKDTQLSGETIQYMDTHYNEFSLGVWNGTRTGRSYICLDGTAGTFYARGAIIPEADFGVTIMMNSGSEEAVEYLTRKLTKAYFNQWWMFWI